MRSNPAAKGATRRVKSDTLPDALLEMSRRFLLVDPKDVTDEDLVAVLLAGAVEGDPYEAATELLVDVQGNLARVARAEGFARRAGFSALAQARMSAAAELVKRAERRASVEGLGGAVISPTQAENIARAYIGGPREQMGALFFDTQMRLLGFRILSMGAQSMTVADPREIVIAALDMRATSVILIHNHPSGVAQPSGPDDTTTGRLAEILRLLGMKLADHIILGKKDATYSYALNARLNPRRSNPAHEDEDGDVPDCAWCGAPCDQPRPYLNRRGEPFCSPTHRAASNRALARFMGEEATRKPRRSNPAASENGRYRFVTNCVGSTYEDISALKETGDQITRATFARALGPAEWKWVQAELGYDRDFRISGDWHVGYYKGGYRGVPAYYLVHSGIEWIFTLDGKQGKSLARGRR
jgi:DNA repair protein RadC